MGQLDSVLWSCWGLMEAQVALREAFSFSLKPKGFIFSAWPFKKKEIGLTFFQLWWDYRAHFYIVLIYCIYGLLREGVIQKNQRKS